MSHTSTPSKPKAESHERTDLAAAPQPAPPRQQRRRSVLALGIALIVVGILAGAWYGTRTEQAQPSLVLTQDMLAGDVLTRDMLRSAPLTVGEGVDSIPVADVDSYEGMMAGGNLPAGTLLAPQMLTDTLPIPESTSLVGVSLTPAQMPSVGVRPGDTISVVVGASNVAAGPATAETLTTPGRTWSAQVAAVGAMQEGGLITVDLAVPNSSATQVAAAAAGGNVALVVHPHQQELDPDFEQGQVPGEDLEPDGQGTGEDIAEQTEAPGQEDPPTPDEDEAEQTGSEQ